MFLAATTNTIAAISITQEYLKQLLDYDQATGEFSWRTKRLGAHIYKDGAPAGHLHKTLGYRTIRIDRKLYLAHRLAWLYVYGKWPLQIDHINRIRSDNRITNLRESTQSQNMANTDKQPTNTSGHKGIYWAKKERKWLVQVAANCKQHYIGYFKTKEEAIAARRAAAERLHGKFANHGS